MHFSGDVLTFEEVFNQFVQYGRLNGRSPKTIELYKWVSQQINNRLSDPILSDLHTVSLRAFFSSLFDLGWKPTSISIVHRVLNAFFNWAIQEMIIENNPLDGVPKPKVAKIFPFMLDDDQVGALLKVCNKSSKTGIRNQLILLLFLDCGLRLNELTQLTIEDISLSQKSLKVMGKGSQERMVFMGSSTTKTMRRWLAMRGIRIGISEHLLIDRKHEKLKARWVQEIVAKIGKQAGLKERLSPHKLRHVSATLAVRNGLDAFSLQRLYGWANIDTAMRYVNAATPALQEAHAKASPIDRLTP